MRSTPPQVLHAVLPVTWGWGTIIQSLLLLVPDVLYGVQVRGHYWPYHMRHSDFLKSSCDNSGTMWWSIIIHEQNVGGVLAELGDDDGFYDVSEVRTCSD